MVPSNKIKFFFPYKTRLSDRTRLKSFIESIFRKEKMALAELNYIFCSDDELLQINRQFLQHNYYTDIITFDLSDTGNAIHAEVYISIERVKDNARKLGVSFRKELHRVIFHGVLHLCGYKDKKA
ncbi:MAG TPA: rRNA maturation RNase YbeY, partial [Chitinophagaceae bacterium]|nr:rRNA maturation RNase YbeY [Chitinophagaceae bacterium]